MADFQNNAPFTIDGLTHPLARALANIRTAIAGLDDAEIWNAIARIEGGFQELRNYPADIAEADLIRADTILRDALEAENAARMARNAPWLAVHVRKESGRWMLSVWHDRGEALRREFAKPDEARAAGEALWEFLKLQGRETEFTYESPPNPADLANIPF